MDAEDMTIQEKLVAYLEQQLLAVIELPSSCQLIQTGINESGSDITLGVFNEFEALFFVKLRFFNDHVLMTCPALKCTKTLPTNSIIQYEFTNAGIANLGTAFRASCITIAEAMEE